MRGILRESKGWYGGANVLTVAVLGRFLGSRLTTRLKGAQYETRVRACWASGQWKRAGKTGVCHNLHAAARPALSCLRSQQLATVVEGRKPQRGER